MGVYYTRDKDGLLQGYNIKGDTPSTDEMGRITADLTGAPPPTVVQDKPQDGIFSNLYHGLERNVDEYQAGGLRVAQAAAEKLSKNGTILGYDSNDFQKMIAEQYRQRDTVPTPQGGFFDQQGAYAKTKYLAGVAGESASSTVGGLGGAAIGAGIGSLAGGVGAIPGAAIGGFIGNIIGGAPQMFDQNAQEQINKYGKVKDWSKVTAATTGQVAVETLSDVVTAKVAGILGRPLSKIGEEAVQRGVSRGLLAAGKHMGEATVTGTVAGGAEEAIQQALQRWSADEPLMNEEAKAQYLENAIVGGILQGAMGGALSIGPAIHEHNIANAEHAAASDAEQEALDLKKQATENPDKYQQLYKKQVPVISTAGQIEDLRSNLPAGLLESPGVAEDRTSTGPFTEPEYRDAVEKVRGQKVVAPDKIKNIMGIGRPKANAIFKAMLDRGDAAPAGSTNQYLRVPQRTERTYEVAPVPNEDAKPFQVIIAGKPRGQGFKTQEEANAWASSTGAKTFEVKQSNITQEHGLYETTKTADGSAVGRRLVKQFPTSAEAHAAAANYDPAYSSKTNEQIAQEAADKAAQTVEGRVVSQLGTTAKRLQDYANKIVGSGRLEIQTPPVINKDYLRSIGVKEANLPAEDQINEGVTMPDIKGQVNSIIGIAKDIYDPAMPVEQKTQKLQGVLTHELVHAMRNLDLLTPKEWDALTAHAYNAKVAGKPYTHMQWIGARLPAGFKGNPVEEGIAEMLRSYSADPTLLEKPARGPIGKLMDFVKRLLGLGKSYEAEDVMKAIFGGKIGEREVGSGGLKDRGYSGNPFYSSVKVPGFYLKTDKFLEQSKQDKASPDQWMGMLRNAGIRQEELDWLGVEDWMKSQDNKSIAKGDLQDYVRANSVDIKEDLLGAPPSANTEDLMYMEQLTGEASDLYRSLYTDFVNSDEYMDYQGGHYSDPFYSWTMMRRANGDEKADRYNRVKMTIELLKKKAEPTRTFHPGTTQEGGKDYREFVFHIPTLDPQFAIAGHFNGWPNIIAHARFKERDFGDGKRTLFIEEMQSDIHQRGRKSGYGTPEVQEQYKQVVKDFHDAADNLSEINQEINYQNKQIRMMNAEMSKDPHLSDMYLKLMLKAQTDLKEAELKRPAAATEHERLRTLMGQLSDAAQLPDAPLKTTWDEFVVKRLVRHAAEQGFDQIAWHGEADSVAHTEGYHGMWTEQTKDPETGEMKTDYYVGRQPDPEVGDPGEKHPVSGIIDFYTRRLRNVINKTFKRFNTGVRFEPGQGKNKNQTFEEMFPTQDDFQSFMAYLEPETVPLSMRKQLQKAGQIIWQQRNYDPAAAFEKAGLKPEQVQQIVDQMTGGFQGPVYDAQGNPAYDKWVMPVSQELKNAALNEGFPLFSATRDNNNVFVGDLNAGDWYEHDDNFYRFRQAASAVRYISKKSKNGYHRALADRLWPYLEEKRIPITVMEGPNNYDPTNLRNKDDIATAQHYFNMSALGLYFPKSNMIILKGKDWKSGFDSGAANETVILHEAIHAATFHRLNDIRSNPEAYSVDERQALVDIVRIRNLAVDHFNNVVNDGNITHPIYRSSRLSNALNGMADGYQEILTYGLTDRDMQDYLKRLPGLQKSDGSLWSSFVNLVSKILGIKNDSLFADLLRASDSLIGKPNPVGNDASPKFSSVSYDNEDDFQLYDWRNADKAKTDPRLAHIVDNPNFKKWFEGSKVVDDYRNPKIVYHGTKANDDFATFYELSHFGTHDAAADRIEANLPPASGMAIGERMGIPFNKVSEWWKNMDQEERDRLIADQHRFIELQKQGARVYPVLLSIKNPLKISDTAVEHDVTAFASAARQAGALSMPEFLKIAATKNKKTLIDTLEKKGYDGFTYVNQAEDAGSWSYVAFRPQQVKSIYNRGGFNEGDPRIDYSATNTNLGRRVPANAPQDRMAELEAKITYDNMAPAVKKAMGWITPKKYKHSVGEGIDSSFINLQDRMMPIGRLIDRVRKNGGFVSNENDVYLRDTLFSGQTDAMLQQNAKSLYEPINEIIKGLAVTAADKDAAKRLNRASKSIVEEYSDPKRAISELYLYAQHAIERNAEMRRRNENVQDRRPEQYDAGSGMTDVEAREILVWINNQRFANQLSDLTRINSLRSAMRRLIQNTNDVRVRSGISPDYQQMALEDGTHAPQYKDYVPLRSFIEEHQDQDADARAFAAVGKGFNIQGKEDKSATGRASLAANVLANAILQNEEAVIRANKAKVGQAMLNLVDSNQTMLSDVAKVIDRRPIKYVYNKDTGTVRAAPDPSIMTDPMVLRVKKDGQQVFIRFTDPRIAKAMGSRGGIGGSAADSIMTGLTKLNRFLAATRTSFNPDFVVSNMLRDLQTAGMNMNELDIKGLKRNVIKNLPAALKGSWQGIRSGDMSNEWAKTFDEFKKMGGMTAYYGTRDLPDTVKKINDTLKEDPSGADPRRVLKQLKAIGHFVEDLNSTVENGIRLSTYRNVRDKLLAMTDDPTDIKNIKRAQERAASVAKNLTVNFNAGGEWKGTMNAMYLFYNAGIQGSSAMVNPFIRSAKVRKMWAGVLLAGVLQDQLMAMLSPDDADGQKVYDKIPPYILEHNMIFMDPFGLSKRGYFQIPLPYLMNSIWNMGRAVSRGARGSYTPGETFNSMYGTLYDSLNPWGGSNNFLNFVAPTVLDPVVDLYTNTNFANQPIAPPANPFGLSENASQRFWNNTSPAYVSVANWISKLTGSSGDYLPGAVEWSPNQIQYVADWGLGGVGTFLQRSFDLFSPIGGKGVLKNMVTGGEWSASDIPIVRRLYGNITTKNDLQDYIAGRDQVLRVRKELQQAHANGDAAHYQEIMQAYPAEYRVSSSINKIENARKKISGQIKKVRNTTKIPDARKEEMIKALKARQDRLVTQANKLLSELR